MYRIFGPLPGVVLLLALFLPACGSATDANKPGALPDTLTMEAVLRLGEETGDVLFGNPVDALFDGRGRLVVADWKLNTLLVFDAEGGPRAQVRLPASVRLHAFTGDRAVGIDGAPCGASNGRKHPPSSI